ncbi:hypothetical protein M407DRAFT_32629, partial [Tulasnella calospora MUT 4182]
MELDELDKSPPMSSKQPTPEIHPNPLLLPPSSCHGSSPAERVTAHDLGWSNTVSRIRRIRLRVTPRDFLPEGIPVPDSVPQAIELSSSEG